jgi:hypothetical protein
LACASGVIVLPAVHRAAQVKAHGVRTLEPVKHEEKTLKSAVINGTTHSGCKG